MDSGRFDLIPQDGTASYANHALQLSAPVVDLVVCSEGALAATGFAARLPSLGYVRPCFDDDSPE